MDTAGLCFAACVAVATILVRTRQSLRWATRGPYNQSKRSHLRLVRDGAASDDAAKRHQSWEWTADSITSLVNKVLCMLLDHPLLSNETMFIASNNIETARSSLAGASVVAIDVEHSSKSFHGYVCTVQVAVPGRPTLVFDALDPIVRAALPGVLRPVLDNEHVLKVLHAGANDVRWLASNFGLFITGPVFDTAIAAQVLGLPMSLGALAERLLGDPHHVPVDQDGAGGHHGQGHHHGHDRHDHHGHDTASGSSHDSSAPSFTSVADLVHKFRQVKAHYQRVDWRRRPLPADYLWYAGIDASLLLPIAGQLIPKLAGGQQGSRAAPSGGTIVRSADLSRLRSVLDKSQAVALVRYDRAAREAWKPLEQLNTALKLMQEHPIAVHNVKEHQEVVSHGYAAVMASQPAAVVTVAGTALSVAQAAAVWAYLRLAHWRHHRALAVDEALEDVGTNGHLWKLAAQSTHAVSDVVQAGSISGQEHTQAVDCQPLHSHGAESLPQSLLQHCELQCNELLPTAHSDSGYEALCTYVSGLSRLLLVSRLQGTPVHDDHDDTPQQEQQQEHAGVAHALGAALQAEIGTPVDAAGGSSSVIGAAGRAPVGSSTAAVASPQAGLPGADQAARDALKQARASRIFTPRSAPLYSNIELLAPDRTVMARIDRKKAAWYLEVGAAEVISGAEVHIQPDGRLAAVTADSGAVPLQLRLLREPRGMGHAGDQFHLSPRLNVCVVCGMTWDEAQRSGGLVRCYLIPRTHRHHFPLAAKSYTSHDVVLTCTGCHRRADVAASTLARLICMELGVAVGGGAVERLRQQWYEADRWAPLGGSRAKAAPVAGTGHGLGATRAAASATGTVSTDEADTATARDDISSTTISGGTANEAALVQTHSKGANAADATAAGQAATAAAADKHTPAPSSSWPPDGRAVTKLMTNIRRPAHALVSSWSHIPQSRRLQLLQELLQGLTTSDAPVPSAGSAGNDTPATDNMTTEDSNTRDSGTTSVYGPLSVAAALHELKRRLSGDAEAARPATTDGQDRNTTAAAAADDTGLADADAAATGSNSDGTTEPQAPASRSEMSRSEMRSGWSSAALRRGTSGQAFVRDWPEMQQQLLQAWAAEEDAGVSMDTAADPAAAVPGTVTSAAVAVPSPSQCALLSRLTVPEILLLATVPTSARIPDMVRAIMLEAQRTHASAHGHDSDGSAAVADGVSGAPGLEVAAAAADAERLDDAAGAQSAAHHSSSYNTTSVTSLALWADPAAHALRHVLLGTAAWARASAKYPPVSSVVPERLPEPTAGYSGDGTAADSEDVLGDTGSGSHGDGLATRGHLDSIAALHTHAQPSYATGQDPDLGMSGLPYDVEARLTVFVRRWRAYMHEALKPVALPGGWSVGYRVLSSGHRIWDKEEPPLVKLAREELGC